MALIFSFCGCQAADRSEEARTLCDTFCGDVKTGDVDKLLTYFSELQASAGSCTFNLPLNRDDMATYIGSNRSALSRDSFCPARDCSETTLMIRQNRRRAPAEKKTGITLRRPRLAWVLLEINRCISIASS